MLVAMNRFRIQPGCEEDLEAVWRNRQSHLDRMPGFKAFHLLRGDLAGDDRLYISHSVWKSAAAFSDWTRSEAFRAAHRDAGGNRDLYLGPPVFEGLTAVLSQGGGAGD